MFFKWSLETRQEKYQRSITNFASFIKSVYLEVAPFSKEERLKLVSRIESFLDESGVLTEQGLLQKSSLLLPNSLRKGNCTS